MYYQKQPFGQWRDDYRFAQLCEIAVKLMGAKTEMTAIDFMTFFKNNEPKAPLEEDPSIGEFLSNFRGK